MRRRMLLLGALLATAAAAAAAQQGAQELVRGNALSGWHLRHAEGQNGWKVADGVLSNTPPSTDLVTDAKFRDFELHYEYKIPKGSNSGVYLRGRYELQIADSFGKEPGNRTDGAVYAQFAPKVNAGKPVGEWNTMHVTLKGQRLTVAQNGKQTLDVELNKGVTGGALDDRTDEPGPLMLQGDHGPVSFRNVRLKPL